MSAVWIRNRVGRTGVRFQVLYRLGGRETPVQAAGTFRTIGPAQELRDRLALQIASGIRPKQRTPERHVYVYIVRLGGLLKIGISVEPKQRARALNAELLHVEYGGRERERELHREFETFRRRGEWFEDVAEIRDYIADRKRSLTALRLHDLEAA